VEEKDKEIEVLEKLVDERNRILDVLPCPVHGQCVPYVLDFIEKHDPQESKQQSIDKENYIHLVPWKKDKTVCGYHSKTIRFTSDSMMANCPECLHPPPQSTDTEKEEEKEIIDKIKHKDVGVVAAYLSTHCREGRWDVINSWNRLARHLEIVGYPPQEPIADVPDVPTKEKENMEKGD